MRGVEFGSNGRGISVAPAVGRVATIGSSVGRPSFGLESGIRVRVIANPFLRRSKASYVENRGPSIFGNPIEAIKNPFTQNTKELNSSRINTQRKVTPRAFSVAAVIAEAEAIVKRAQSPKVAVQQFRPRVLENYVRTPEPLEVRLPKPVRGLDVRIITNPFQAPQVEANSQSNAQQRVENRAANRLTRVISTPTLHQTQVEQIVEEKKVVAEKQRDDKSQAKRSEKTTQLKVKIVEAVQVSERRRLEIKMAVKRARAEVEKSGLRGITGRLVRKLLANTFWEHKSPIVGEGRDGTINPTAYEMEADTTEYKDEKEAETALVQAVAKHIPVNIGEGGRTATLEEVREVLEGKEKKNLRSNTPAEMVVKRVVAAENKTVASTGQVVNTLVEEKEEVKGEPTLNSLGLEEVFPKAA